MKKYDFRGVGTRYNVKCTDGVTIASGSFDAQNDTIVPLCWQHFHSEPKNVLGNARLICHHDKVDVECLFNDTDSAKDAKELVKHHDVKGLSIYATHVKREGNLVTSGVIQEVSLVLKPANPGAFITDVLVHSDNKEFTEEDYALLNSNPNDPKFKDDDITIDETRIIIHSDPEDGLELYQSDNESDEADSESNNSTEKEETADEVLKTLTEKQRAIVDFYVEASYNLGYSEAKKEAEETAKKNKGKEEVAHSDKEDNSMNFFDKYKSNQTIQQSNTKVAVISHADLDEAVLSARDGSAASLKGTLKAFITKTLNATIENYKEQDTLAHADGGNQEAQAYVANNKDNYAMALKTLDAIKHADNNASATGNDTTLSYGIQDIAKLMPESTPVGTFTLDNDTSWVGKVLNGVTKNPAATFHSRIIDLTGEKARALGYAKNGAKKIEQLLKASKRGVEPFTVYVKQKVNRNDMIDLDSWDAVLFLQNEMSAKLAEEVARAILIGDGREEGSEDKIDESKIIPVYKDGLDIEDQGSLYVTRVAVDAVANDDANNTKYASKLIDAIIANRKELKTTKKPSLFGSYEVLNGLDLLKDLNGHFIFDAESLKAKLKVEDIVPVDAMSGLSRVDDNGNTYDLPLIEMNMSDYYIGRNKKGTEALFTDFDIDYNQYKYLIETRLSGMIPAPKKAIIFERKTAATTPTEPSNDTEAQG